MMTPIEPGEQLPAGATPAEKAAAHTRRAFLFKLSLLLNGAVGTVLAVPILGYVLGPAFRKSSSYDSWISLGTASQFPEGETRLVDYRNPVGGAFRRRDREHPLLGASHLREQVSGLRHQLRPPGLSGALVCAVEALSLPLPRRRLL